MQRRIELDILKGILIILVVVGHWTGLQPWIHQFIYWFHMPVFFMISGCFIKKPEINPFKDKAFILKQIQRYVIPFYSWCILFYLLTYPEGIIKYAMRIIYAGSLNITFYSYPYWFINTLFLSVCILSFINYIVDKCKWGGILMCTIIGFWLITHYLMPYTFPLPWGLNQMFGAVCYMWIGMNMLNRNLMQWPIILCASLFLIVFIMINILGYMHYDLNMMSIIYPNVILDVIIPIVFLIVLLSICYVLSYLEFVAIPLAYIGKCSLTIFFVHAFVMHFTQGLNGILQLLFPIIMGVIQHSLLQKNRFFTMLFLGK